MVNMAKHHNGLGEVNPIMRRFCKMVASFDSNMLQQLERVMNAEIAIDTKVKEAETAKTKYPVNPLVLAQPEFIYLSAAEKLQKLDYY